MSNVNANVNIIVNTKQAIAQIRSLQAEINNFNKQSFSSGSAAASQQRKLNSALLEAANISGQFSAKIVPVTTAVDRFSSSLEKNKLSLSQYTRYASSQLPGMTRVFKKEFDMIQQLAESRVKRVSQQFVLLGKSANGMQQALAMMPNQLDAFGSRAAISIQKQQIFNKLLSDGSTQLLNWGKNTQWAGRQLMVGFTIPLGIFAGVAAKTFKDLEAQAINFKKVYGDMFTTDQEVDKNLQAIKDLSKEFTKYGIAVKDSMALANIAAQSGARGTELIAATTEATRLSVLGQIESQKAIETTISLQNAFGLSSEKLTDSINFLNAVENQSVLSLEDVTEAIPRAATVIQGLGGDVKDLSVLLVAMKEGGVSAAEGANALKNSLGRLISPTKDASATAEKYGIDLQKIVQSNRGQLIPMLQELGTELNKVGGQEQQELLSKIFGKFQYARVGALLKNITQEGSQAQTVMKLTAMSTRDLAATAERELSTVENSVSTKFTAAMENLKLSIAPIGEQFLKALTPIIEFVSKIAKSFENLPDPVKNAMLAITAVVGGVAPIVLMVTGLIANAIANASKLVLSIRKQIAVLRGNGDAFKFYTMEELDAAAASASLEGKVSSLTGSMVLQQKAIKTLTGLLTEYAAGARAAAVALPTTMGGRGFSGKLPNVQKRNKGGAIFAENGTTVPGTGNSDTVPAMLTPGEYVINKRSTKRNLPLIEAINNGLSLPKLSQGGIPRYAFGGMIPRPKIPVANQVAATKMAQQEDGFNVYTAGNFKGGISEKPVKNFDNVRNLHGPGIYTTAERSMAESYLKRSSEGSASKERSLYEMKVRQSSQKKFLDIDKHPDDISNFYKIENEIEKNVIKNGLNWEKIKPDMGQDASTIANWRNIVTENTVEELIKIRGAKTREQLLDIEYDASMMFVNAAEKSGYMGLTHIGGGVVGNGDKMHKVYIWYKPPQNLKQMSDGGMVPMKFADGGTVPGIGNKDTIPALLTPGESVITKEATQKFGPILTAMNKGTVGKFNQGLNPPQSNWVYAHGQDSPILTQAQSDKIRAESGNKAIKETPGRLKGFSNFGFMLPEGANKGQMSPAQLQKLFNDPKLTNRIMYPMYKAIATNLGKTVEQVKNDPKISKQVKEYAKRVGSSVGKIPSDVVSDKDFYKAVKETSTAGLKDVTAGKKLAQQITSVKTVNERRGARGERVGISQRAQQKALGYKQAMTSYLSDKGVKEQRQTMKVAAKQEKVLVKQERQSQQKNLAVDKSIRRQKELLAKRESQSLNKQISERAANLKKSGVPQNEAFVRARQQMTGNSGGRSYGFMPKDAAGSAKPTGKFASGIGKFGMGAGMALSMGSMLPMMNQDKEGKFMGVNAGIASMGMMGAGTVMSMVGMLPQQLIAPVLAASAGLAAIGITAKVLNDNMINAAKKSAEFGANIGGTENSLNTISALFNEKTPAQRSTQMQLAFSAEEQAQSYGEFQNYLGSETGQSFIKGFEDLTGAERFKKLIDYIRSGIASGIFDEQKARLFAKTVGNALNDSVLGSSVIADLKKNSQKTGSEGLFDIAKNRQNAVEINDKIISGSNEMIGASIQIIQDYANALALANEEFAQGTINYSEFSKMATQAKQAQDQYSSSLKDSLTYIAGTEEVTYTSGSGVAAFNSEMEKILNPDQMDALRKATETGLFYQAPVIDGIGVNAYEGLAKSEIGSAIASGMDADQVISIMQQIRDDQEGELAKSFAKYAGTGNAIPIVAFEETSNIMAESLGLSEDLNDKFKELGVTFLKTGGNLGEFQSFISNLPENLRDSTINSLESMSAEARKRVITGGTALAGAYGERSGRVLSSKVYKKAVKEAEGTKNRFGDVYTSRESLDNLEKTQKTLIKLIEDFGVDTAIDLQIAANTLQNGKEIDIDKWNDDMSHLSSQVKIIQANFPPEISSQIKIDFTSSENIAMWAESSKVFSDNINTLTQLNPNIEISTVIRFLTLDEKGKKLTPEEVADKTIALNKAWKQLESSKNVEVRRKAMMTIVTAYQDENGKLMDPSKAKDNFAELEKKFGGKIYNLSPDLIYSSIQLKINADSFIQQAESIERQLPNINDIEMRRVLAAKAISYRAAAAGLESRANTGVETGLSNLNAGGGASGGGGGAESPLKSFVQGILDQVKMWTDADATLKTLNNSKESFVKQVLKGQGIFDKLKGVKGISKSTLEQVLGMGPEGANDFIKKYVKSGKLNEVGKNILNASSAARINQTIDMNVLGKETLNMQTKASNKLRRSGASDELIQEIGGDPQKSADYLKLQRAAATGIKGAKKDLKEYLAAQQGIVNAAKEEERARRSIEEITQERFDVVNLDFDIQELQTRKKFEEDFVVANGMTVEKMQRQVDLINDEIAVAQDLVDIQQEQINLISRENEMSQRKIEGYQDQIDAQQKLIDEKQRANELDQREIDSLSRQDELRNRIASSLSHELDIMSQKETEITKVYDKRLEALDKVATLNDRILQSQQDQLNVSQALSTGDIYAATAAAQQMRQNQAQSAQQNVRDALEKGMQNQIEGLRTSSGLTRDEAEAQIRSIEEQSYQASLKKQEIEDRIYQRNIDMIPIQDEIYRIKKDLILPIEDEIEKRNKLIREHNDEIYRISNDIIVPKTKIRDLNADILSDYEKTLGYAVADLTIAGKTRKEWDDIQSATSKYLSQKQLLDDVNTTWSNIVSNMAAAALLAPKIGSPSIEVPKKEYAGGLMKYSSGGNVYGDGSRDSVSSMLTPGEFVVRKAMVNKYGIPMLSAINQGSFSMPKYSMPKSQGMAKIESNNSTNISAPMYNSYSVGVNVSNAGASADEIANITIAKIKQMQNTQIRSGRGY
jgi:TP901 family phage tail tape measure protein